MIKRKHSGSDLTIFSEMTALAIKNNAVNLSQGFPDFEIDGRLQSFLAEATHQNFNQYAPMPGNPLLIENLIQFNAKRNLPIALAPENITISPGASYGIFTALAAILQFGDEVIVWEPCYDSYVPSIEINGGIPVFLSLTDDFQIDFEALKNAINHRTKAIIVNSPHNPSGKILKKEDYDRLAELLEGSQIILISDEVYDVLTYDHGEFYSAFNHLKLKNQSLCIFSFGKMFHATGWKIGYVLASEELTAAYRRIHQYLGFSVNAPAQQALANFLEVFDVEENRKFLQKKRDFFLETFRDLPFTIRQKAEAGYFQILGFENISDLSDKDFAVWLTEIGKVASIPVSAFYQNANDTKSVRFCFAKKEETLLRAAEKLKDFFK
ncbi:methionine aminotransferase [Chryseobacterium koreense]|uniref:Aminotransferase class I/classII large domain-containing protein n=1 Tax=Chryseobacterium koreense CCUG 49689 TaxID=1304281 RepID=A0A0J7IYN5_9FLAO|nr:methionine aminotransferase [Chryseobacterium koreense]KMQ70946.1 hypothetical protein ACM44_10050 [Chryseobacterium koreense CCUG 49689]MBB5332388.1 methionine aminotransferase [Chryseobacterium koreense]